MLVFTIGAILELIAAELDGGEPGVTGLSPWATSSMLELIGIALLLLSCFDFPWQYAPTEYGLEFWGFCVLLVGSCWELNISGKDWDASGIFDATGDGIDDILILACCIFV